MHEQINEKINVITVYNSQQKTVVPYAFKWQGRIHRVTKIGYHHTQREGRTLHHIFSVSTGSLAFRLRMDTETLSWTLEEVSDGIAH